MTFTRVPPAPRSLPRSACVLAGVAAFVWFLTLSHLLLVRPGTIVTREIDVVFSSDMAGRIYTLAGAAPPRLSISHALLGYVWGPIGGVIRIGVESFADADTARTLAARILVAAVAACGVGALAWTAAELAVAPAAAALLLLVYLLFTAQVLVALPDHMGISNGILSAGVAVFLSRARDRTKTVLLAVTLFLVAATTITNAIFPAAALALTFMARMHANRRRNLVMSAALAGVVLAAAAVAGFVWRADVIGRGDTIVHRFFNPVIVTQPIQAALNAVAGVLYPAVAPAAHLLMLPRHPVLSYEPMRLQDYGLVTGAGAVAWIVLLAMAIAAALRKEETRQAAVLLVGWVVFNLVFHNVWGDEFFLYTPHWSWALIALVILGHEPLRRLRVLVPLTALIVAGQIVALTSIVRLLNTL